MRKGKRTRKHKTSRGAESVSIKILNASTSLVSMLLSNRSRNLRRVVTFCRLLMKSNFGCIASLCVASHTLYTCMVLLLDSFLENYCILFFRLQYYRILFCCIHTYFTDHNSPKLQYKLNCCGIFFFILPYKIIINSS